MRKTLACWALLSVGALALTGCTPNIRTWHPPLRDLRRPMVSLTSALATLHASSVTTAKAGKVTLKPKMRALRSTSLRAWL